MRTLLLLIVCLLTISQSGLAQTPDSQLIEAAQFGRYQPVGLAISKTGRTFVSFPHWTNDYQFGLIELTANGGQQPYPNPAWNGWDTLAPQDNFVSAQALFIDSTDALWVLDPANPNFGPSQPAGVKLLKINLSTNKVEQIYRFADLPLAKTALNDVQVDAARQVAYLSDPGRAALVVLDLKTGKSRTVLTKHPSTTADPARALTIDGQVVRDRAGKPFASHVNGIALTPDGQYLYYRAITQTHLFRIATSYLTTPGLSDAQVAAGVEDIGEVGISHGMIAGPGQLIYMGDSEKKTIYYANAGGQSATLVQDDCLLWPDSFATGPDGFLYVTAAQYQRLPRFNNGQNKIEYPFRLYKVKLR
jgi:sugar lactone lactonase YvrE